ncbi:hypothetical protein EVAR_47387_1 [Eumeta japonica]|uniref:Uncharacterized protein n=1 Tax=Eumeta variegata TaxID=151549 RepID=A0A4C1WWS3_EUMVA|nr:hypothetical protein EVAR_47387_1 [Eumeta japonica]
MKSRGRTPFEGTSRNMVVRSSMRRSALIGMSLFKRRVSRAGAPPRGGDALVLEGRVELVVETCRRQNEGTRGYVIGQQTNTGNETPIQKLEPSGLDPKWLG